MQGKLGFFSSEGLVDFFAQGTPEGPLAAGLLRLLPVKRSDPFFEARSVLLQDLKIRQWNFVSAGGFTSNRIKGSF
jgi:hypothetical protein